ncbi:MAG: hypothetical protein J5J00_12335 [Deltaproteobacteria bacterium]|nr:hypothetical protein [Deltaproteobacteria bacterium]
MLAVIFTALPSLLFFVVLSRKSLFQSRLTTLAAAIVAGEIFATYLAYFLSCVLREVTSGVLQKAAFTALAIMLAGITCSLASQKWRAAAALELKKFPLRSLPLLALFAWCGDQFYSHHLIRDGDIYRTQIYWDFTVIFPIVQSFVAGDNFPPENPLFSGVQLTYHYLPSLLVAVYSTFGLDLPDAINLFSIIQFSLLMLTVTAAGEEFFESKAAGLVAALLLATSGSLRFVSEFAGRKNQTVSEIISELYYNEQHPYLFALLQGNPFGYDGNMFNVFYYLQERQLLLAGSLLMIGLLIVYRRERLALFEAIAAGILFGFLFHWHIAAAMILLWSLFFFSVLCAHRSKSIAITAACMMAFGLNVVWTKATINAPQFQSLLNDFPKINFGFIEPPNVVRDFSIVRFFDYWVYSYGFRLPVIALGFSLLLRRNRCAALLLLCTAIPTFIALNTVQFFPLNIHENHKFLKLLDIPLALACAYGIVRIWSLKSFVSPVAAVVIAVAATLSGLIEIVPYLRSRPEVRMADTSIEPVEILKKNTPPDSVFVTPRATLVLMAGRRLFHTNLSDLNGNRELYDHYLKHRERHSSVMEIYGSRTVSELCKLTAKNGIDYIEPLVLRTRLLSIKGAATLNINTPQLSAVFWNLKDACSGF